MHHIFQRLSELTGQSDLAFNADGRLELLIDNETLIEFRHVNDMSVELYAATDLRVDLTDAHVLGVLLGANYLGAGVGSARLGIEDGMVVLSERLELPVGDGRAVIARIEEFIQRVQYWSSSHVLDFFKPPVSISFDQAVIRV